MTKKSFKRSPWAKGKRRCKPTSAKRTNPKLWEQVKSVVKRGSKGGKPGKWSARKSQLAVAMYKKRGGRYIGKKDPCNSLTKWSKEKWGYVRGSNPKKHKGRYLPKVVRDSLSAKERREENKRKGSKRGKWVSYSKSVAKKMRKHGIV
jgi:hypothetical protein